MATIIKDGYGKTRYASSAGAGTKTNPSVPTIDLYGNLIGLGAKSLELTLNGSGAGSFPIDDSWSLIGIRPAATTNGRFGLEVPEANGSATGTALAADFKKGIPMMDAGVWNFFTVDKSVAGKVGYILGTAAAKFEICGQ